MHTADYRLRQATPPKNLTRLRRMALNQLKPQTVIGLSLPRKRLCASGDQAYLLKVLGTNI